MNRAGIVLLLALAVAACGDKEAVLEPAKLKPVKPTIDISSTWTRRLGDPSETQGLRLQPALAGPNVVIAGEGGRVACLSRTDGKRRWRIDTGAQFAAGPVVAYNQVFLGTRKGELLALSADDGHVLWRAVLSSEMLAPAAVGSDVVVVKTLDGRVSAFEREDGKARWSWQGPAPTLGLRAASAPLLVADGVLVGLASGELVALTRDEGEPLWQRRIAEPAGKSELDRLVDIASDLSMSGDTLYVATYQGRLVAMDLRTGQFTWQQPISSYRALAVDKGNVYAVDADSNIIAFRGTDGTVLWRQGALSGRSLTAPVPVGDNLLVADFDGWVHLVREADGEIVGRLRTGTGQIAADPLVEDGAAWILDRDGRVSALAFAPWDDVPHPPAWTWGE